MVIHDTRRPMLTDDGYLLMQRDAKALWAAWEMGQSHRIVTPKDAQTPYPTPPPECGANPRIN